MYYPIWQHYTLTITCDPQTKQGQILVFDFYNWMAISIYCFTLTHDDDERIDKLAKAATGATDYTCHVEISQRPGCLEVLPTARTLLSGQMPPITSPIPKT